MLSRKQESRIGQGREKRRRDRKMQFKKKVPAKSSGKAGLEKEQ